MHSLSLAELLPANVFAVTLVLSRMAGAVMFLPGFGDLYVPTRVRASFALLLTLVVTPTVAPLLPPQPTSGLGVFACVLDESFIGLFIGLSARVLLAALETAGAIIAMQSSLSSAIVFNPGANHAETLPASLLGGISLVLMFSMNLHYFLLVGLVNSYQAFPATGVPPFDDLSAAMVKLVSVGFVIAIRIAAPYMILGTLFYVGLGLTGRIMPQLQIFFIGLPLQIMGALVMLSITVSASVLWFLGSFQALLTNLTRGP
jgi:flagellar biosynthetic protein FliR